MPRTRSLAWSELKIGMAAIAAVILVVVLVLAVGGEGGYWWQRYSLKARFHDVQGLKPGAVVRLAGKEIGAVTAVEFTPNADIEVIFELLEDVRPLVTTEARAQIGSLSLLGEPIIDLTSPGGGQPLDDWAYVPTGTVPALADLTTSASASLQQMDQLLTDVRGGHPGH
jgi:phospholipid/cholesterol/gamma-HCH transport system substrate-binding protein